MRYFGITIIALILSIVAAAQAPSPIAGPSSVCAGAFIVLTDSTTGGSWRSSDTAIATIDTVGNLRGVSAGVANITYDITTGFAIHAVTVLPQPGAITGPTSVCAGTTATFGNSAPGGMWSSSFTTTATVSVATGLVTGVAAGVTFITYSLPGGCSAFRSFTVRAAPAAITGSMSVCAAGGTTTLSSVTSGGTWVSSNPTIGSIGTSGIVTGVSAGAVSISYYLASGCLATTIVTVQPVPNILGSDSICEAGSTTLSSLVPGGAWSSSIPSVASVHTSSGTVSAIMPGMVIITYLAPSGCRHQRGIVVKPSSSTIVGRTSFCLHSVESYSATAVGGTWHSSNAGVVAIDSIAGTATALAAGAATLTYIMPGGCPSHLAVSTLSLPVADSVTGGGSYCSGGAGAPVGLLLSSIGVDYQLLLGGLPIGAVVAGSGSAIHFGDFTAPGVYEVIATDPVTGCRQQMAGTAVVSVSALPTAYLVTGGGGFCTGGGGTLIGLSGSESGVSYQLWKGVAVGSPVLGSGSSISFGLHAVAGYYMVRATNTATGCIALMTDSVSVTVYPYPISFTIIGGGGYCAGTPGVPVNLSGSSTGVLYQLLVGTSVVDTLYGTGSTLSFGLQTISGTYTVRATNLLSGCATTMAGTTNVLEHPLPPVHTVTGGGHYCSGGAGVAVGVSGSNPGVLYQLYIGTSPTGPAVSGTGSVVSFGPQVVAGTYAAQAVDAVTGCAVPMVGSVAVTIDPNLSPSVTLLVTPGDTICPGTLATFTATPANGGTSPSYSWRLNGVLISGASTNVYTTTSLMHRDVVSVTMVSSEVCTTRPSADTSQLMGVVVPGPIGGTPTVCEGGITSLTHAISGGTWSSSFTPVATVHSGSGAVHGVSIGTTSITYTIGAGCYVTSALTVHPTPSGILGPFTVCAGATIHLTDSAGGGAWASSHPDIATVATIGASTGVVIGITGGTSVITYSFTTGCATTRQVTVIPMPGAGIHTVSTPTSCSGGRGLVVELSRTDTGVLYQLYNGTIAVGSPVYGTGSRLDYGLRTSPGVYSVAAISPITGCSVHMHGSVSIAGNRIGGHIYFDTIPPSRTDTKVWLMKVDPIDSTLIALDSTVTCLDGSDPYYEFTAVSAGSYRIQASVPDGTRPGGSGYLPTFGNAAIHWASATRLVHAGFVDSMDVRLVSGIVPAGTASISGNINAGSGRGTASALPVEGMLVYLLDATTRRPLTHVYTTADGDYLFSNIAPGTYLVYPEQFAYYTISSNIIALDTAIGYRATPVNFRQYASARLISPYHALGMNTGNVDQPISLYPNPASNLVHLLPRANLKGAATVVIRSVTGATVHTTQIEWQGAGVDIKVSLPSLPTGVYSVSVVGADLQYTTKLLIEP